MMFRITGYWETLLGSSHDYRQVPSKSTSIDRPGSLEGYNVHGYRICPLRFKPNQPVTDGGHKEKELFGRLFDAIILANFGPFLPISLSALFSTCHIPGNESVLQDRWASAGTMLLDDFERWRGNWRLLEAVCSLFEWSFRCDLLCLTLTITARLTWFNFRPTMIKWPLIMIYRSKATFWLFELLKKLNLPRTNVGLKSGKIQHLEPKIELV